MKSYIKPLTEEIIIPDLLKNGNMGNDKSVGNAINAPGHSKAKEYEEDEEIDWEMNIWE